MTKNKGTKVNNLLAKNLLRGITGNLDSHYKIETALKIIHIFLLVEADYCLVIITSLWLKFRTAFKDKVMWIAINKLLI